MSRISLFSVLREINRTSLRAFIFALKCGMLSMRMVVERRRLSTVDTMSQSEQRMRRVLIAFSRSETQLTWRKGRRGRRRRGRVGGRERGRVGGREGGWEGEREEGEGGERKGGIKERRE